MDDFDSNLLPEDEQICFDFSPHSPPRTESDLSDIIKKTEGALTTISAQLSILKEINFRLIGELEQVRKRKTTETISPSKKSKFSISMKGIKALREEVRILRQIHNDPITQDPIEPTPPRTTSCMNKQQINRLWYAYRKELVLFLESERNRLVALQ